MSALRRWRWLLVSSALLLAFVRVRHLDDSGKVSSEQVVSNVSHGALDQSLFEVPAGYEKQEMPSFKPR